MITLVGAGFLGGIFAEEVAKRLWAMEMEGRAFEFRIIDSATFEQRNVANQNVRCADFMTDRNGAVGLSVPQQPLKANVAARIMEDYDSIAVSVIARVDEESITDLIPPENTEVIVDAVDNLQTRQLLWAHGLKHGIPVLHLGLTQAGTGAVEWTIDSVQDTFSLSPIQTLGRKPDEEVPEPRKLRPCELIAHRATGFLVAHRGAVALGHFFGLDPEEMFPDLAMTGFASSWQISENGIQHVRNFTELVY